MRRKRRGRLRWGPVFWLLVTLNAMVALYASRLFAVHEVSAYGVREYDRPRVRGILAKLRGVPHAEISNAKFETEVMREPSVKYAALTTGMLGVGNLRVVYRNPVAKLVGYDNLAVDDEGVVYAAPDLPEGLTPLQLPAGGAPPTLLSFMGTWQAKRLADLAVDVRKIHTSENVGIEVEEGGSICLNVGPGRVVLGSCDDLDHKLKVLGQRLVERPDELAQVAELVLTNPDSPRVVKK